MESIGNTWNGEECFIVVRERRYDGTTKNTKNTKESGERNAFIPFLLFHHFVISSSPRPSAILRPLC